MDGHQRIWVIGLKSVRFFFIWLSFLTLIGCDNGAVDDLRSELEMKNKTITELEQKLNSLEEEKRELQKERDRHTLEKDFFAEISNQAYQFVQAHISGNREEIQKFLGNGLTLTEKDRDLYVTFPVSGDEVEVRVYQEDSPYVFKGMIIQGYNYDPNEEVYRVHIREFYEHTDPQHVFLPTFVNLSFQRMENDWKIVQIEFDV